MFCSHIDHVAAGSATLMQLRARMLIHSILQSRYWQSHARGELYINESCVSYICMSVKTHVEDNCQPPVST